MTAQPMVVAGKAVAAAMVLSFNKVNMVKVVISDRRKSLVLVCYGRAEIYDGIYIFCCSNYIGADTMLTRGKTLILQ